MTPREAIAQLGDEEAARVLSRALDVLDVLAMTAPRLHNLLVREAELTRFIQREVREHLGARPHDGLSYTSELPELAR